MTATAPVAPQDFAENLAGAFAREPGSVRAGYHGISLRWEAREYDLQEIPAVRRAKEALDAESDRWLQGFASDSNDAYDAAFLAYNQALADEALSLTIGNLAWAGAMIARAVPCPHTWFQHAFVQYATAYPPRERVVHIALEIDIDYETWRMRQLGVPLPDPEDDRELPDLPRMLMHGRVVPLVRAGRDLEDSDWLFALATVHEDQDIEALMHELHGKVCPNPDVGTVCAWLQHHGIALYRPGTLYV